MTLQKKNKKKLSVVLIPDFITCLILEDSTFGGVASHREVTDIGLNLSTFPSSGSCMDVFLMKRSLEQLLSLILLGLA